MNIDEILAVINAEKLNRVARAQFLYEETGKQSFNIIKETIFEVCIKLEENFKKYFDEKNKNFTE